ncbi:LPXTG cell wall anchor domain-containing protein [Actinomyces urogenitalis]|nr:LPXTG cell wall anchor domain-containing protein [Actinomyces urogenitalis]MCI7457574.1 LPXTG cell wall anchor domain-containing protein [Actinomyces urogenitalis]
MTPCSPKTGASALAALLGASGLAGLGSLMVTGRRRRDED